MYYDLTKGKITKSLLLFALPMMAGDILQQVYNLADTLIVGRVLGKNALAAVGSAYTLMTFLTSIFIGLALGAGTLFSIYRGKQNDEDLRTAIVHGFGLTMLCTLVINLLVYLFIDPILHFLRVPVDVWDGIRTYLLVIFAGLFATSVYNFFACLLRALGNSTVPVIFLLVSTVVNIGLDLLFVAVFSYGIAGAAAATIIAQYISAVGITIYVLCDCKELLPKRENLHFDRKIAGDILNLSSMTCIQQSIMNFGILMIQGLVNSFGAVTMAAFAAAVKIDTFAYLPAQDFGSAYATFTAQNYGAGDKKRIKEGTKQAFLLSGIFCAVISALVFLFAEPLMKIFISAKETDVIASGVLYLRVEGACYIGIGFLFLLYGYFRAVKKAGMSVVLTVLSLGTRVVLAYALSPFIGEVGIWMAIPIGWALADIVGIICLRKSIVHSKIM